MVGGSLFFSFFFVNGSFRIVFTKTSLKELFPRLGSVINANEIVYQI